MCASNVEFYRYPFLRLFSGLLSYFYTGHKPPGACHAEESQAFHDFSRKG